MSLRDGRRILSGAAPIGLVEQYACIIYHPVFHPQLQEHRAEPESAVIA
jgi:hypothetical protein